MPAARRMARFTATFATSTLYAFWLIGRAPFTAASAAAAAVSSVIFFPTSACSASGDHHGIGATAPITILADCTIAPLNDSSTVANAIGQSCDAL